MKKNNEQVPFIRNYNRNYTYYSKIRRRKIIGRVLLIAGGILIFLLGYFLMEMLLDISHMPPV